MSTRSVIAIPQGDGWKGRYCHSDGYPSHQLVAIQSLVSRDGLEPVLSTIVNGPHYGWLYISPEGASLGPGRQDGRFAAVPGYGIAYTYDPTVPFGPQAEEADWITSEGDDWGTEWCYVLSSGGVAVFERDGDAWTPRGFARWGAADLGF